MFWRRDRGERQPGMRRVVGPFALIVIIATVVCSGMGFLLAQRADEAGEAENRQALRVAIETMGPGRRENGLPDTEQLRFLESISGLKGLSVEVEAEGGDRSTQSLVGTNGRIAGWLSWEPERPATRLMLEFLPFLALTTMGVLLLSGIALWQLSRMRLRIALDAQTVAARSSVDRLTGFPNQYGLREVLEDALVRREADEVVAFGYLDLDRFEDVNHSVGSDIGDDILRGVGDRLRENLPAGTPIGRVGGDCFGLVITAEDAEAAREIAERACQAIARPFRIGPHVIQVTTGAGFAVVPEHGSTREQLAPRAELALNAAKKHGRGSVMLFAPDMEADIQEQHFIKRELASALAGHALDLHYQPIVTADTGTIIGVEALLRWNHPTRGYIPPGVFVPIAEQSGLMDRLGQFVLRRALADAANWPNIYVAVNLSPLQVRDRSFADVLATLIAETQFNPSRLILEITEGVLIENPDETKQRLEELRALGARLALDDFGAGYSSLSYLQTLPFDKLKIDRSFVVALEQSENGGVIIHAIVALGRALGMSVLVEGVETEEQRILLRLAGCNEMQGYLFARPAPRAEIDRLVEAGAGPATGRVPWPPSQNRIGLQA